MSRHQRLIRLLITILLAGGSGASQVAAADPFQAMLLGKWDGYDGTHADVWADGDYAYMGTFTLEDYQAARIHVLDISDPMAPSLATTFFLPPPNDLASPQDIKVADGLLFVALEYSPSDDGVAIIDVRDPTNPSLLATVAIEGFSSIHNLFYADGFLYLADGDDPEIAIVDLRDFDPDNPPASPITEYYWLVTNVGSSFVHDITVTGGYLYASAWNSGIKILGIENVADLPPHVLGEADGDNVHAAWPTDDGRFVVVAEEREDGGITVYEITENGGLLTLTLRDAYSIPNISTHNVVVVGYRAYCSWYEAGLLVFDLDPDTGELSLRASYDTPTGSEPGFNGAWGVYPFLGPERVLVSDTEEGFHVIATWPDDCTPANDCNMNGQSDFCDLLDGTSDDCNGTLIPDECDIAAGTSSDCQENTIPDECEPDCNANEVPDDCDITQDSSEDCNDNEVPDECDIASGTSEDCNEDGAPDECIGLEDDCNANGIPDECIELEDDCNGNAVPDACDITEGTSEDCTGDGIPDECDSDCNGNGVADSCDIDAGTSQDCNENDIPDECETDCNGNGVADSCDIDAGTSQDCNYNQVPDECDVANGTSHDCNENGVPDECIDFELDCNSNGIPDECEPDCNGNGIPDDCDVLPGLSWLLTKLSHDQAVITALVPDRFDFTDGETGTNIPDGGNDMYTFGNILNTNLDHDIEYTDNTVVASDDQFGPGSEYFTAKYTGLFIMATSGIAIDHFELLGNTGAGGDGDVNGSIFSAVSAGQVFTIFVKRIFGAGDPSITHIIIVPGDGPGVSHNFSNWTGTDQHEVLGLEAVNSLYFLVVARQNGLYLENESVRSVAEAFLDILVVDSSSDCNANQVPDECDIADGSSDDRNRNGIPDECEQLPCEGDANGDGLVDPLDSGFVLARFGCPVDSGDPDCDTADQNDDGLVDPLDVGFILARFGPCE